jgi:NAD(P)-dependent dehydrogenase (short-subunit alcohol dehydrogenase family)
VVGVKKRREGSIVKPNFDISGKVAVITGGAGILCGEMSRQLAECGCKVAILGRTEEKTLRLAEEIRSKGGTAIGIGADVLDKASMLRARDKVLAEFGRVDILINGAGGNKKEVHERDMSFFDFLLMR